MDVRILCVDERHGTPCLVGCPACIDEDCDPRSRATVAEASLMYPDWDPAAIIPAAIIPAAIIEEARKMGIQVGEG